MTDGMRVLLESIVVTSRAQIRNLEVQIKNINGLLYVGKGNCQNENCGVLHEGDTEILDEMERRDNEA